MEVLGSIFLSAYILFWSIDSLYLHIFRYGLHAWKYTRKEFTVHTIRTILLPGIIYCFLIDGTAWERIGIALYVLDLTTYLIGIYFESNRKEVMKGLPNHEYIIHLLMISFYLIAMAVLMNRDSVNLQVSENSFWHFLYTPKVEFFNYYYFLFLFSLLVSFLHLALLTKTGKRIFVKMQNYFYKP